jgi:hypothetical protein
MKENKEREGEKKKEGKTGHSYTLTSFGDQTMG